MNRINLWVALMPLLFLAGCYSDGKAAAVVTKLCTDNNGVLTVSIKSVQFAADSVDVTCVMDFTNGVLHDK